MPKDGADGLLRNVVISVGVDFANEKVGFDPQTLNAQNIRLYPSNRPQISIESFVIADENNALLVIEPSQLLAPNTLYTFEISQGLRDKAGNSFGPYKIQFSTGAKSIPKRISTDRPQFVHQARKIYYQPKREIFVEPAIAERSVESTIKVEKTIAVETENPATNQTKPEAAKDNITQTKTQREESSAVVEVAIETEQKPEKTSVPLRTEESSVGLSQNEKIAEESQPEPVLPTNEPKRSVEAETKIENSEEMIASISFPSSQISLKGKLPVSFNLPDNSPIQYIVKNTRGEVVKKGSGKLKAGQHEKFLSMSDLPTGRYQILIKTNGVRQKHVFEIR